VLVVVAVVGGVVFAVVDVVDVVLVRDGDVAAALAVHVVVVLAGVVALGRAALVEVTLVGAVQVAVVGVVDVVAVRDGDVAAALAVHVVVARVFLMGGGGHRILPGVLAAVGESL